MPVKKLDPLKQSHIVTSFTHGYSSIEQLATMWGVSRRTIIRVLEDHDVDPGIKRRVRKPKLAPLAAPTNLAQRQFYPPTVDNMPWIYRMVHKVRAFFTS